jgi:fluoride exporter
VTFLLVAAGAAVGAPLRYVVDVLIQRRHPSVFPWGTLAVNVTGSFIIGIVMAASGNGDLGDPVVAGLAVGFAGALTTYSTFSYETLRLLESGARRFALANVALSVAAGLAAVSVGWLIGSWIRF